MRRYVKGVLAGIFLLLACRCYLESVLFTEALEQKKNVVTIQNEAAPLSRQQVQAMQEIEKKQENMFDFTAWSQKNDVWLETEFKRMEKVSAVFLCGSGEVVFPENTGLQAEDTEGCLLDEKTALSLFGSVNVTGMSVFYDGTEKIIRGILREVENTIVMQGSGEEITFPYMTVRCSPQQNRRQVENDFMTRHALNGTVIRMETVVQMADVLTVILPLAVGIWVIRMAGKTLWGNAAGKGEQGKDRLKTEVQGKEGQRKKGDVEKWNVEKIIALCVCVFSGAACFWLLAAHLQIPADMIPTKWSDFSFWSSWWEKERESLLILLLSEKQKPMQIWLEEFYMVIKYSVFSWMFGWIFCSILGKYGRR